MKRPQAGPALLDDTNPTADAPDLAAIREAMRQLANRFDMTYLDAEQLRASSPDFDRLPLVAAQRRGCLLLHSAVPGGRHVAVSCDPFDTETGLFLEHLAAGAVDWALAAEADLHATFGRHEAGARAIDTALEHRDVGEVGRIAIEELSLASLESSDSPTVKLVNSTLYDALRSGASDIHFESTADGLRVQYRLDGVLDAVAEIPGVKAAERVISRLKVLADLDIAERRVPQDGSFRVSALGRQIDMRISVMPSVHGEDAVVRVLDKQAILKSRQSLTLEALGFDDASLRALRELAGLPYGMLLVTGPTGSGKTTTLYAALAESFTGRDKVITIEDPVEYQLPGILQIPVNEKKGLTFARGLRSILRHDPDRIMVGEIRDRETAEIAVQSALTGHMVLSTVHANSAFDVFGRFLHMGLEPYALVSALNGIWAQRLMRINCPHCTRPSAPSALELERCGLVASDAGGFAFARGFGCGDCRGTGYKGRRAIAELLRLTDELREMIVDKQPLRRIKEAAQRGGGRSLRETALELAQRGLTTLEEVRRVTMAG